LNPSLSALIKACKKLGLTYKHVHRHKFAVRILPKNGSSPFFFIYNKLPFNSACTARILDDKDLSYTILKNKVRLPKWKSYIDPQSEEGDKSLVEFCSIRKIANDIRKRFNSSVIVKRNGGSRGMNVFMCHTLKDITQALKEIFNKKSPYYDYLAIGQEYIEARTEIRAIATPDKLLLAYVRDLDMSKLPKVITSESWLDCVYNKIHDKRLLGKIESFLSPVFENIPIGIVGADISIDASGRMYLLELNHSPIFDYYIDYAGDDDIVDIYTHLLKTHCC
jgi:hypothetical protein